MCFYKNDINITNNNNKNNSISKGVLPDNAKIASVTPIDKPSYDKNKLSNFRPVIILNTFSKIYESNNIFSPYFAAYRESFIRLLEEWRENLASLMTY